LGLVVHAGAHRNRRFRGGRRAAVGRIHDETRALAALRAAASDRAPASSGSFRAASCGGRAGK
jgi:hypothetical protein